MKGPRPLRGNTFQAGEEVQLSALGRERCPQLPRRSAVVVRASSRTLAVLVLFSGRKTPIALHISYVERVQECPAGAVI